MDKALDEMKNRISLALKDPILQQGFEIICKNLSELEKENKELKTELGSKSSIIADLDESEGNLVSQLEEAKELLREFVNWANWQGNSKCPSFKNIQDKAEAFLKEE